MLYQEKFQNEENPAEINVSCCVYQNGIQEESFGFPNHCHSFFELEYLLEGDGESFINGERIPTKAHCLLVKPPLCMHGYHGNGKSSNMILQFGYNFLNKCASTFHQSSLLAPTGKLYKHCLINVDACSILETLLAQLVDLSPTFITPLSSAERRIHYCPLYEWKLDYLTLGVLTFLLENGYLTITQNACIFSDVAQLQTVLNHLIKYPEERLELNEAAKLAGMSYSYFSRTFKKIIGRSYVDYCNMNKIRRAEELLEARTLSVTEVAMSLGFGTTSYFNRIFRQYNGITPTQYLKNRR